MSIFSRKVMKPNYIVELNKKLEELKAPYVLENEKGDCFLISLTDEGRIRFALGYKGEEKKPHEQITFNPKMTKELFAVLLELIGEVDEK